MKIHIEVNDALPEDEVIIRCAAVDERIERIRHFLEQQARQAREITFYKGEDSFFFPVAQVLFFETEGEWVYAHTEHDAYRTKLRLYELEEILGEGFVRVSKSAILNTGKVYAIQRQLAPDANAVRFAGTHKQVFVSRRYLKILKQRMQERNRT